MKFSEIKTKSLEDLKQMLVDLKREQFNLRFQKVSGELSSFARFRQTRKDIARVKTLMNQNKKAKEA